MFAVSECIWYMQVSRELPEATNVNLSLLFTAHSNRTLVIHSPEGELDCFNLHVT